MPLFIKNCGLKTTDAIDQSIATKASFVGFVHHAVSPRHVSIAQMTELVAHTGKRAKTVAVLVTPDDALLDAVMAANPDYIQLHEVLNPSRIQEIGARYNKPIISALSIRSAADLTYVPTLEEVSDYLLFDAKNPGSGKPFDWHLLKHLSLGRPWFLAGGLTSENIAEALRVTHAPMVDVSSGIEEPAGSGNKSLEKIAAFNAAVLAATHA